MLLTLTRTTGGIYPRVVFNKISPSYQRNVTLVFVSLSPNNLASEASDGIIISTFGFSQRVYKVNFCKSEKRISLLQT